ncbi:MAG: phosphate acetyltransferase [Deltaproteobacteria bacterium HGW-Deltaproteobacteria-21]|nr:MAG: phosphate acetyltransferase [Deltaproteobacteria bacterium HGW-Deltaproteobacteria-21]
MEQLRARARANPQRVVFPEAGEEKILRAVCEIRDQGLARPMLIGKPDVISVQAQGMGVSLEAIQIIDHTAQETVERFAEAFGKVNSDFPASAIKRKLRDPLMFAAMMVRLDEADCMVAGLSHTTGEVIMASEMIIGLQEGISTVSSTGILVIPGYEGPEGSLLGIADCAVCPAPGSQELADIAISTADTIRTLLGWEPRVALLSFSTKGSAGHERVDTVLKALEMVRERRPDILIDGELQLDAAIAPEVADKKVKGESPVAGKANILIFPNLESGNIGVKLVQQFAHAVAYGPLLQGFAKTVSDLSRGAPVEEIIGAVTMAVVRAQNQRNVQ